MGAAQAADRAGSVSGRRPAQHFAAFRCTWVDSAAFAAVLERQTQQERRSKVDQFVCQPSRAAHALTRASGQLYSHVRPSTTDDGQLSGRGPPWWCHGACLGQLCLPCCMRKPRLWPPRHAASDGVQGRLSCGITHELWGGSECQKGLKRLARISLMYCCAQPPNQDAGSCAGRQTWLTQQAHTLTAAWPDSRHLRAATSLLVPPAAHLGMQVGTLALHAPLVEGLLPLALPGPAQ